MDVINTKALMIKITTKTTIYFRCGVGFFIGIKYLKIDADLE